MALIGYVRVSTAEQNTALQTDALRKAGCKRIFEDTVSGVKADRPGLAAVLAYLRDGDVLTVWRLDRLGRSLPHLIETIGALEARGVGFRSLSKASIPPPRVGASFSMCSVPWVSLNAISSVNAPKRDWLLPLHADERAGAGPSLPPISCDVHVNTSPMD